MANTLSALTFNEEPLPVTTVETTPKPTEIDANSITKTENPENNTVDKEIISPPTETNNGENDVSKVQENNGVLRCVGRSNRGVTWGEFTDQGRRRTMEDNVRIFPGLMQLTCNEFGGCTAPECKYAAEKSPVHYFGVFDGHGGDQVSKYCAIELHKMVAEEWGRESGMDGWRKRWEVALCRAYGRADDALKDKSLAPYSVGTTASVVILSACQIIAANCGDSRVVLCRGKQAIPLTVDHKLDREDEVARITNGGGRIVNWGCLRVEGVLSMTRAIGDHDLKPWIISEPEVTFTTRSEDDEFLILASDGLWDVLSNDDVVKLAHYDLRQQRKQPKKDDTSSSPACYVAEELLKIALDALSCDNISIIIVDLKFPRRRCLPSAVKRDEKQT